jgi:hypothetical protein
LTFNVSNETNQFLIFNLKDETTMVNAKMKLLIGDDNEIKWKGLLIYFLVGASSLVLIVISALVLWRRKKTTTSYCD